MSQLMNQYIDKRKELFDHVGFDPDWVSCPIDDATNCWWGITEHDEVVYGESEQDVIDVSGECYMDSIYKQRFYSKYVFEGDDLTMVMCDPHVDGVQWFRFFDNDKRVKIK